MYAEDNTLMTAINWIMARMTVVILYPKRSTTKLERKAPSACPAKGIEFMADLTEDDSAYVFVVAS